MPRKLKVFRTAVGFHDAYVAAPSRKAALAAWGSDADLFARGVAEEVTDAALVDEPLAHPGEVIRRSRGTVDEHFAALPKNMLREKKPAETPGEKSTRSPPSRKALDQAEAALDTENAAFRAAAASLKRREDALAAERRALEERHAIDSRDLRREVDEAKSSYEEKAAAWR